MNYQKAMEKRHLAEELRDQAISLVREGDDKQGDIYLDLAMKRWEEHAQLLQVVYPSPQPKHPIQVTFFDRHWVHNEGQEMKVLETSFETLSEYIKAQKTLWDDYDLESPSVGQCEMCNKYYLAKDGHTTGRQGFCSQECLEEDEHLRQIEGEYWEDHYAERVVDSDPYDRDTYFF